MPVASWLIPNLYILISKQEVLIVMNPPNCSHSTLRAGSTRLTGALVGSALLPLLLVGCGHKKDAGAAQHAAMGPIPVVAMAVEQKSVPIYGNWVGNLAGYVTANIQPEVSGYLIHQNYKEGAPVYKGEVLFEIDPRPFEAIVNQAKGQVAQVEAQLQLAEINLHRDTPLAREHAISQSQLDNDQQQVAAQKAALISAKASLQTAELNLGFTRVRSLINGISGLAQTQVGSLVSPSTTITTVSEVDPIKVYFSISEQEYLTLSSRVRAAGDSDLLHSGSSIPLQLTLANGEIYPQKGRIVFVDRAVDPQTGTIRIAGAFPNPGDILRPGQFGHIRALTGTEKDAMLVPQQALNEMQGTYLVDVVGTDNKLHIVPVVLGPQYGSMQIIRAGLKPGELVVIEGIEKLREGMDVTPHVVQAAPPNTDSAPNPEGI